MATIVNKVAGKINNSINKITSTISPATQGPLNKLWRAKILINRAKSPLPKDPNNISSNLPGVIGNTIDKLQSKLGGLNVSFTSPDPAKGGNPIIKQQLVDYQKNQLYDPVNGNTLRNKVIIYNLNASPYQYIELQNRPNQIDFRGETTWATIKSMGRNLPMYHYTSAEDIIQFNVSWYCNDPNNDGEVLFKCRLLESWTKGNGFKSSPPILYIQWGSSDMFANHKYILFSATYSLMDFRNSSLDRRSDPMLARGHGLYPSRATQELVFKRVSYYNPSWQDYVTSDQLQRTKGISMTEQIEPQSRSWT